jgi:hypothetical protein
LVGDASSIHLWLDWWYPDGILYEQYVYRIIYDARSKLEAKLASVMKGKEWDWQQARSESLVSIQSKLLLVKIGENDEPIWVISKIRETWEAIRTKQQKVSWWKLIWFSCAIPKHTFAVWLALRNCLSIGD